MLRIRFLSLILPFNCKIGVTVSVAVEAHHPHADLSPSREKGACSEVPQVTMPAWSAFLVAPPQFLFQLAYPLLGSAPSLLLYRPGLLLGSQQLFRLG